MLNKQLHELYSSKWIGLCNAFKPILDGNHFEIKPTNPLLIHIEKEDEFRSSDIKVMICGQEANSWYGEFNNSMEPLQSYYNGFFNRGDCWSYGDQFWNGFRKFWTMLENRFPDKKINYIWNNIVKIGKSNDKGFPPEYIYEIERNYFSILKDEIKIIKPNIILFLTGPNYDRVITDVFGHLQYNAIPPFSERSLSLIELKEVDFTFRTYHPNFLWRNNIENFFSVIINEIKF
jgi:hypothetical protein